MLHQPKYRIECITSLRNLHFHYKMKSRVVCPLISSSYPSKNQNFWLITSSIKTRPRLFSDGLQKVFTHWESKTFHFEPIVNNL